MEIGQHFEDDDLERYSMGAMSEKVAASFEEHLLICAACRKRLDDCDEFVAAIKTAASRFRDSAADRMPPATAHTINVFRPSWLLALASVALAWVLVRAGNFLDASTPQPVALVATRGALPGADAKAGERLALSPDATGLPSFPSYRVDVVDAVGRPVASAEWKQSPVITPRLAEGMYFVRISSHTGELLREYGLAVKRTTSN